MDRNIHDNDDFFKQAYEQFEDTPSASVWQKINEGLDKKEADGNKRKFIWWRRLSMILLFLFAGFILFDSAIFKKDTGMVNKLAVNKNDSTAHQVQTNFTQDNNPVENADKQKLLLKKTKQDEIASNKQNIFLQKNTDNFFVNPITKDAALAANHTLWVQNKHAKITATNADIFNEQSYTLLKLKSFFRQQIFAVAPGKKQYGVNHIIKPGLFNKLVFSLPAGIKNIKTGETNKIKLPKNNSFNPYWLLTSFISYDRANYKLDSELPANISSIKFGEVHEPSFSAGVLLTRQIKNKWGIASGFIYSYTAIGISPQKLYALQDPTGDIAFKYNTSSGYAYIKPGLGMPPAIGDSLSTREGKHTLQFVRIPAMLKYTIGKNKLTITPGAGLEANFLTNAKIETEIEHPVNPEIVFIDKLQGAKPFHLSVAADVDVQYPLNKKILLTLRPSFRYAISPITANSVVETFPYSFGVGVGVKIKF